MPSRVHPGWAPFSGALSRNSQVQAVVMVASLIIWLQAARYLLANPWLLVNQTTGNDADKKMIDSKAFSETAMLEILRFIEVPPPSPSRSRMRFIESVGLR